MVDNRRISLMIDEKKFRCLLAILFVVVPELLDDRLGGRVVLAGVANSLSQLRKAFLELAGDLRILGVVVLIDDLGRVEP